MARNILVVEDDNNISNLIKMYLDKEGFDVRIAADGGKAVEEFKEKEPDLVLLDVMLPVLDGWGVCAKIRETSKCPIIMLTAKGEVNDRIHGLEMGADDYVVKPFEMKELLARINAVLRRSEIPEDTHKRLEQLEEITGSYPGVDKAYAIQAGREVRVMVKPDQVSEDQMVILARELAKKIEEEMEYPGQIKVHVLRETTAIEYAK